MAVRSFATNNLVKEHDLYVKFMKKRWAYISEEGGEPTEVLFCKKGIMSDILDLKFDEKNQNKSTAKICVAINSIKKWHSIGIAYDIWCDLAKFYVDKVDHNRIPFKKFVDMPEDILKKFKFRFEQSVKNAKCGYTAYGKALVDPCRLLAMFWTYLELVNDEKTQRYFPNKATTERAAKVFGYNKGEDPFKLNGTFKKCAVYKKEEKPVEETKATKYNLNLDTPISDLNFSTRTFNALRWAGYHKLGDIVNLKYENLIKIRNLGLVSTKEVLEKLNEIRQQSEAKEESVIDIAEQAAKEVEAERSIEPLNRDALNSYNILSATHDALKKKYENLLELSRTQCDKYDELLKQKLELETCVSRLRDDIHVLKEENKELTAQGSKLRIASDPKNLDTFALLNTVLEKMKDSKMEYILLTIDGMCIDIHPAQKVPLRSAYQIRSSER